MPVILWRSRSSNSIAPGKPDAGAQSLQVVFFDKRAFQGNRWRMTSDACLELKLLKPSYASEFGASSTNTIVAF